MKRHLLTFIVAVVLSSPVLAHHSLGLYDSTKPVTISGTVTKLQWTNPHVWIFLSVNKADGVVEQRIQIAAPGRLKQLGFDRSLLAVGSAINIEAWLPKDPQHDLVPNGRTLTLSDGRRFDVSDNWPMVVPRTQ